MGVDVVGLDGERLLVVGHARVDVAELALGIADHGEHHGIVLVPDRAEGDERVLVVAGNRERAARLIEFLVVEQAGVDAHVASVGL